MARPRPDEETVSATRRDASRVDSRVVAMLRQLRSRKGGVEMWICGKGKDCALQDPAIVR